ncbi:MAG: DUF2298 domain-containing protein [Lentisphaerota bacterium]
MTHSSSMVCLQLYALVQTTSLAIWPVLRRLLPALPDQGYGFSKLLGVFLQGYVFWILYALGWLPNTPFGATTALLMLLLLSGLLLLKPWPPPGQNPLALFVVFELVFLLSFIGWALYRSTDPSTAHTEQPMDMMMLNALWTSDSFPPHDPWLSGAPVGYYFFGYWLLNTLGQTIGQPPEIMYNTGQALWFALLLGGAFSVVYNLIQFPVGSKNPWYGITGGLLAGLSIGICSNLQGFIDALTRPADPLWWWSASRPLRDILPDGRALELITEFPLFSYVLGDNHPHLLAMPFVLLAIGFLLNLLFQSQAQEYVTSSSMPTGWRAPLACGPAGFHFPGGWIFFLSLSLVMGSLLFLNAWDYPALWALQVGALFFATRRILTAGFLTLCIMLASIILFLPYHLIAQSQAEGLLFHHSLHFNPLRELLVFGLVLPALALLILQIPEAIRSRRISENKPLLFALGLFTAGLALVAVPEVVFVKDLFGHRMNTVFKFYYEAWLFFGLAGSYAVATALAARKQRWLTSVSLCCLAAGLIYPSRIVFPALIRGESRGLNALAPDGLLSEPEVEAIRWIRRHTPRNAVVAEAPGLSYQPLYNRISTYTGRPTLLGWQGHERQWRGRAFADMSAGRLEALNRIYMADPGTPLQPTLIQWDISYVYLGPAEYFAYNITPETLETLGRMMKPVFSNATVRIFERQRRPPISP